MFMMDHAHMVLGNPLPETYSLPLVLLSILIAILSSFTAFGTSERQYNSTQRSHKIAWNLFGATSMGLGIWAMHFIGMLAFKLPVPVSYDVFITVMSVIPAICACSVVLWIMTQKEYSSKHLVIGGIILGSGIGLMHYIGMAAMRMDAVMVHDLFLFYLSILVAVALAIMALKVVKYTQYEFLTKRQVISSVVIGFAISCMHYIAMASADFYPYRHAHEISGINPSALTIIVAGVVFVILLFAIAVPYFLRYKQMTGRLDENLKRLRFALSAASQGWFDLNPRTGILSVSDGYALLLGYEPEEFVSNFDEWQKNIHPDDRKHTLEATKKILLGNGPVKYECRRQTKEGDWIWLGSVAEVVEWDNDRQAVRVIGIQTDITERKEHQNVLEQMAHYDALTQLPNRSLFADRFSQAIAHSKRSQSLLAICFLDLDNFKFVNDNFGHDAGDQLLIEVTKRIKTHIREEDTVSRQGGDEFALLLRNLDSFEQCEEMLKRIQHSIAKPYLINDHPHNISASIGVTLYPNDDGDIDTLIRHADQAMYQAKISGKNCYHLFDVLDVQQTIQKQTQLNEIKNAFLNNEFELYYQPKVNMTTGKIYGVEALIRWIHPEKGVLSPSTFLPVIEGSALEIDFGNWVINQALYQLDKWKQLAIGLEISINISSHHIQSESFLAQLGGALDKWPEVEPQHLQIEILESSALGDLAAISNSLMICRDKLGVQVALDDFGTSYSSLTHLRSLPAEIIKIDRSFVRDMIEDPSDCAIIEGVIALANSFNRKVISEGVELVEQGEMLILMGCKLAQGYCISPAIPAEEIPLWLKNYQPVQQWISVGSLRLSPKQKRLKLFDLTVSRWHKRFISNMLSLPSESSSWPIMERTNCPCGLWIRRENLGGLFELTCLEMLNNSHNLIHDLAEKMQNQYLNNELDQARAGVDEFNRIFETMKTMMVEQG